ncbi:MAG TPA: hypothetical protein DIT40_09245 [Alphaproteobacteria bacterium]|jgi:predicted O-methyltransferase YrrM|nr:hypothetical protein [Alphaproteobacteria bacterium]HBA42393.1 hypothetical protein [Alphaproteobacteria bacterium]HBC55310.1 hypothetical protein [Alphaproteobacteria bacterium]HCO91143.1 hypothetical protein [Alphaproteobacteria bacterium]
MQFTLPQLPIDIQQVKGFMDAQEGAALHHYAAQVAERGPGLEIGSYCGKSTVYLGTAFKAAGSLLFALDHHRGSEENQPGWDYHDTDLWDKAADAMDTLPFLRRTLRAARLEETVIPLVTRSTLAARFWTMPLSFVFIDGGHTFEAAANDYRCWAPHVQPGGILAIHDIFPDPADGGQAPYEIYKLALASGLFEELATVKTLAVLRRILV